MPYGTIKVDNVTFTNAGVDQNVTVSGLYASTTSNLSVTGTVSGSVLIGSTTVSGATVSGQNASFVSGVFTTGLFSGRVGIGTVTPGYRLTVVNSTGAFDTNLFLTETADPTSKRTALSFNNAWLLNSDTNGVGVEDFGIYSVANNRTLLNFTSGGGTLIDAAFGQVPLILYSVGSEIARFTASSRLGLGTASPNGLLHLQGNSIAESWYTATGASGGSWRVGVGDSLAGLNGGYRIYDATNSATRFFITSGGFVGVKTATPNASFHANHTTLVEPSLIYNSTAGQVFQNELNELAFGVATGVPYATWMQTRSAFSAATPLAINPSGGFIGIGTKSPGSILHCNIATATDTYIRTTNSGATNGFDFGVSSGAEAYLFNRNNTNLYFGTNSNVRATITSGGNFGIGTQSPVERLTVSGDFSNYSNNFIASNIYYDDSTAQWRYLGNGSAGVVKFADSSNVTTFGTAVTNVSGANAPANVINQFVIDPAGRVGVTSDITNVVGKLHVQLGSGYTPGAAWNDNLAVFGGMGSLSSAFAIAHDTTSGTRFVSLQPGVSWRNIDLQCSQVLFSPNGSVEAGRFNNNGILLLGTQTSRNNQFNTALTAKVQVEGVDHNTSCVSIIRSEVSAGVQYGPNLMLGSTGGGGLNSNTLSSGNGYYGNISFQGTNGTNFVETVVIRGEIDGTCTSGSMPGRCTIYTTPSGSLSPTERLRVTRAGYLKVTNSGGVYNNAAGTYNEFYQTAADVNLLARATNASYANAIFYAGADRAANTAYSFFNGTSNWSVAADTEFNLRGDGTGLCDGTWTGGGADYAEFFEWEDGNTNQEDRRGIAVVLTENKIREAFPGEDPIGVISGNPSVVGDAAWNKWSGKYLRDEFGTYVQEDYEVEDDDGNVIIQQRRKLNPAYDPSVEYIPREQRPEWDCVGLMGKLRIRKGQVTGSRWIKMRDINDSVEEWLVR